METDFFPQRPKVQPMIYAYEDTNPQYEGMLKVGFTAIGVDKRVAQQYPTKRPTGSVPYRIMYRGSAMYPDGTSFNDTAVHDALKRMKKEWMGGEWFRCTVDDVRAAVLAVRNHTENVEDRVNDFKMRPEQEAAVERTASYFQQMHRENQLHPKFLWNCKMRFGKTFAAYELAKRMGFKRILILTFKPAVVSAWQEDLNTHIDFEGWQFISRDTELTYEKADPDRPIVCFGSFQDFLGVDRETGGIKPKNQWVHTTNWDLVIFDEYHFGAWKENAKSLFEQEDDDNYDSGNPEKYDRDSIYDETFLPITTDYYLFLSGTPFHVLNSGEFIEEQIYSWTYTDEQQAKVNWKGENNPYAALPRMVMMTYRMPDSIRKIAMQGEFNEFDLNVFFSAEGKGKEAHFVYANEVQKWLDLIRGAYMETTVDDLKLGAKKPAMPYADVRFLNVLQHTLWFLPNVASCYAMKNLLMQRQNTFYHDYTINVCAGAEAGIGAAALKPVRKSMRDPLNSKTITLSCGKLTTGVTVKPWTGIFMLRNLSSPETYFQAAFRVQSPWEITIDGGKKEILKKECYVFDFALERALKQISDYSCQLNIAKGNPEKKVGDFIRFLPVIAYDGSTMKQINAGEILDIAMSGTSATMLARRWESALLVNVDNLTLSRLLANSEAMAALMKIEGFRSLNDDIETIINKSEAVKKAKKDSTRKLTPEEKKELTQEEKEYRAKRREIQEKLIKFATRIPLFMYLTDYREYCLKDVITRLEPGLFKRVTGLTVKDFELLLSIGLFNDGLMNDAVYKFRRYEDSSLNYTGIDRHEGEKQGGWDTVISAEDYRQMFALQQDSIKVSPEEKTSVEESVSATKKAGKPPKKLSEGKQIKTKKSVKEKVEKVISKISAVKEYISKDSVSLSAAAEKADISGIAVGTSVIHKVFGKGTVTKVEADSIEVYFDSQPSRHKNKKFLFPQSFEQGFLKKE